MEFEPAWLFKNIKTLLWMFRQDNGIVMGFEGRSKTIHLTLFTLLPHPWASLQVPGVCHRFGAWEDAAQWWHDLAVADALQHTQLRPFQGEIHFSGLLTASSAEPNRGRGHGGKFRCTQWGRLIMIFAIVRSCRARTSKKLNTFFKRKFFIIVPL